MEQLPQLTTELVLDNLSIDQVLGFCKLSRYYAALCLNYWPNRAVRKLRVTPEQWGEPSNPYQRYLELYNQCLPEALDMPINRVCGRKLGSYANVEAIEHYLQRGGNPEDVAYGAATVGAQEVVLDLMKRYPHYASSIARKASRGAGSVGRDPVPYVGPISTDEVSEYALKEAAATGSLDVVLQVINWIGYSRPYASQLLAFWGYGTLAGGLGCVPNPIFSAARVGDWATISDYLDNPSTRYLTLEYAGKVASASTIKQIMDYKPEIAQWLLGMLYGSKRDDVFLEVIDWLRQTPPPITPVPDLTSFKQAAATSGIWELENYDWSD